MADILTFTFGTLMSEPGPKRGAPPSGSTLLVGDRAMGRSVLLLAAVTAASELGSRVVFFTRTRIQSLPAPLHKRLPNRSPDGLKVESASLVKCGSGVKGPGSDSGLSLVFLKRITFCYPGTAQELLQQVARLHETTPPSLIVLDRLEAYLCAGERSCAAHLCALLCDTAAFLTRVLERRSSGSAPCRLLASYHPEPRPGPDPVLDVLRRYFQMRCTLDRDRGQEAAAAAGLQERWHVELSGEAWHLLVHPGGAMELKMVCNEGASLTDLC